MQVVFYDMALDTMKTFEDDLFKFYNIWHLKTPICKTHILNLIYPSSIQNGIETVKSSDVECVFLPGR